MAQLLSVRLQRNDGSPWGFRLQGGVDFGSPLVIQKVNGGSIADRAGLQAGDAVLRVNSTEVFNLRHKDAQDSIVRAGSTFEMTVQRGSSTWKPSVTAVGSLPTANSSLNNVSPVTKTSLAANKPVSAPIGTGHNVSAKPFLNGSSDNKLVNKQYNSPIGLYSEQSIAETLSAQTEVLSTGVLGVNFKKNEKAYNAANSEVLKMVQESEKDPRDSEPVSARSEYYSHASHAVGGRATSPRPLTPLAQQLGASGNIRDINPKTQYLSGSGGTQARDHLTPPSVHRPSLPIAQETPICTECERTIVGVFVRIKDKNLHVECFKCATCGASLKNVGYYNINKKLYCDIHAKLAARNNPPAPNLVPVTIPPGATIPAGTIAHALQSHSLPSPSPLSPSAGSAPAPIFNPSSNVLSGPRPFSSSTAPMSPMSSVSAPTANNYSATLPRAAATTQPEIIIDDQINTKDVETKQDQSQEIGKPNLNWPPPKQNEELPTATPLYIPPNPSKIALRPVNTSQSCVSQFGQQHVESISIQEKQVSEASCTASHFETAEMKNTQVSSSKSSTFATDINSNIVSSETKDCSDLKRTVNQTFKTQISLPIESTESNIVDENNQNDIDGHNLKLEPKMSICSSEVSNIIGFKNPMECVEVISGTLDTQMLVETIKERLRPPTPPPLPENPVVFAESKSKNILIKHNTIPKDGPKIVNNIKTVVEQVDNVQKQLEIVAKQVNTVQQQLECVEKNTVVEKENTINANLEAVCPLNKLECKNRNQSCEIEECPNKKLGEDMPIEICPKIESIFSKSNFSEICSQSCQESINISSVSNPTPKEWKSPFVTALTTTSETPHSQIETKEYLDSNVEFPHTKTKPITSSLTSALTVVSDKPFTPVLPVSLKPVSLPEETIPYLPPETPIVIEKKQSNRSETKSPFIDALTTAPARPYTPLGICEQSEDVNLMKDMPAPPYESITMLSALTTTPDRPFTPVWNSTESCPLQENEVNVACELEQNMQTKNKKPDFKSTPPKTIAPTIQSLKFEPTGRPLSATFPPVSDELKSSFKPTTEISPSKIIEETTQQQNVTHKSFETCNILQKQYAEQVCTAQNISQTEQINPITGQTSIRPTSFYSSSGLHKPSAIPRYQQNLSVLQSQTPIKTPEPDSNHIYEQAPVVSMEYQQPTVNESKQRVQKLAQKQTQSCMSSQEKHVSQTVQAQKISKLYESSQETSLADNINIQTESAKHSQKIIKTKQVNPNSNLIPQMTFQPVVGESPRSVTPSSHPARSVTPSLINNPAPIIPYYQVNLITTEHLAPETNIFDPKSPAVSRSPSPHPDRSKSPFSSKLSVRSHSPAAGPPSNPLRAQAPRIKNDKNNVHKQCNVFMKSKSAGAHIETCEKHVKFQETPNNQTVNKQIVSEKTSTQMSNVQQMSKKHQSLETSTDGSVQIQRKKTSTEEFEHTHKSLEIERATSSSITYNKSGLSTNEQSIQSPIIQVQSAKGLKSYETSTGRPLPVPQPFAFTANTVQIESADSTAESKTTSMILSQSDNKVASNNFIKSQPFSGIPTSIAPSTIQPHPKSAFSTVPQKLPKNVSSAPQLNLDTNTNNVCIKASKQLSHASFPTFTDRNTSSKPPTNLPLPNAGAVAPAPSFGGPKPASVGGGIGGKGKQTGAIPITPRRGRGILNKASGPGTRIPLCAHCNGHIRGPFISALGKIWCPEHFVCATPQCRRPLQDLGFVEEQGLLYCEHCFEQYLAPTCSQCRNKIKGDCLKAIGKHYHPECFTCSHCGKLFGNNPFFLEDAQPYCEADWNELFTTKCFACGFPVEAGDRWVEALNNNYHSQCFNCAMCKKNLEGQSFYAKGGRPFCKNHAR